MNGILDGLGLGNLLGDNSAPNVLVPYGESHNQYLSGLDAVQTAQANTKHQNILAQAYQRTERPAKPIEIVGVNPTHAKAETVFKKFYDSIPFRLAARITRVGFQLEAKGEGGRLYFVVLFDNGGEIKFYDIENFPSDSDLGRIALEAPC